MVLTAKKKAQILNAHIEKKPDNPRRMHMTHAEAVEDNRRLKIKMDKIKEARANLYEDEQQLEEEKVNIVNEPVEKPSKYDNLPEEVKAQCEALEEEKSGIRGPGSKSRRDAVDEKIKNLIAESKVS